MRIGLREGRSADSARQNWDGDGPRPLTWAAWYPASDDAVEPELLGGAPLCIMVRLRFGRSRRPSARGATPLSRGIAVARDGRSGPGPGTARPAIGPARFHCHRGKSSWRYEHRALSRRRVLVLVGAGARPERNARRAGVAAGTSPVASTWTGSLSPVSPPAPTLPLRFWAPSRRSLASRLPA